MAENENLASMLVKSGLNSIFTDSPIGYFSKFANVLPLPMPDGLIFKWNSIIKNQDIAKINGQCGFSILTSTVSVLKLQ